MHSITRLANNNNIIIIIAKNFSLLLRIPRSQSKSQKMYKLIAVTIAALVGLVALVSASGYGYGNAAGYGQNSGYSAPQQSYGQNYERKTGFKTVIYHPYGGTSNRFDYRTFPAYAGSGYNSYNS